MKTDISKPECCVYLGVDNTQPGQLRIVCLEVSGLRDPGPLWYKRIHDHRAMIELITPYLGRIMVVATTPAAHDPFGILHWLTMVHGLRLIRVGRHEVPWYFDACVDDTPKPYRRALTIAHCAAYDYGAPRLVCQLQQEIWRLRTQLDQIQENLHLINNPDEIPF